MNEHIRFFAPADTTQINAAIIGESDLAGGARKGETAAVTDRRYNGAEAARGDARPTSCPPFDCVKASQARSDLIKASILFFGLDGDCPSPSDKVAAC